LPLICFGYSLGALIAYETSKQLIQNGLCPPLELVVAAARAPHIPRKTAPVSSLPDTEFIAKLRSYGGTPEPVLQDKDLLGHFLPILRADFATAENYRLSQFTPLPCPITAIAGSSDNSVGVSAVAAWEMHTSGRFALHQLEGGHFFIHKQLHSVIAIVRGLAARHVDTQIADDSTQTERNFAPQVFGS
jgi:medium-chain acyl-[acyl-carrier-protein] hydrolase